MFRDNSAGRQARGRRGWRTSQALVPVDIRQDDNEGVGEHNSEAWRDSALYSSDASGPYIAPPWSPDRATQFKTRPMMERPVPVPARIALLLINILGFACVGYAMTILIPRISDPSGEADERVGLLGATGVVIAFAVLGLLTHIATFAWRLTRRRRFPRRAPSRAPSFGTIFVAWAGIAALLATLGSAQLEEWGSTRLPDSVGTSSSSSSAAQEAAVVREMWSGSVTDPGGERLGGLLMTVEDNAVTSLTMAIDSEGCPKALDLRGRAQIDPSSVRITLGRQRDQAVLKGKFQGDRFTGRLSIGTCELNARVAASPRGE